MSKAGSEQEIEKNEKQAETSNTDNIDRLELLKGTEKTLTPPETKAELPELELVSGADRAVEAFKLPQTLREIAHPKAGQGYFDPLEAAGKEILGRNLEQKEIRAMVAASRSLQEMRGKNSASLSTKDMLLPENEKELELFVSRLKGDKDADIQAFGSVFEEKLRACCKTEAPESRQDATESRLDMNNSRNDGIEKKEKDEKTEKQENNQKQENEEKSEGADEKDKARPVYKGETKSITASWYQSGSQTANGEKFKPDGLTAAHKTLPFGTKLEVTNPSNGESVVVRINDRGPFIKGRQLDLSRGAARELGMIDSGVADLKYRIVSG